MIKSFADKNTNKIWNGEWVKKIPTTIQNIGRRKMRMLSNSHTLTDLRIPPSNHLERLVGNRKSQYSIRMNNQWRITFDWENNDAFDVKIEDYH